MRTTEAAELGLSELGRHKEVLVERLAIATDRYERIAYEDEITAVEALIDGFKARQPDKGASSNIHTLETLQDEDSSVMDPRALSPGEALTLSDLNDD